MNGTEFQMKWCSQFDEMSKRFHMALTEAGIEAELHQLTLLCDHEHLTVGGDDAEKWDPITVQRAMELAWPLEAVKDWETFNGGGPMPSPLKNRVR